MHRLELHLENIFFQFSLQNCYFVLPLESQGGGKKDEVLPQESQGEKKKEETHEQESGFSVIEGTGKTSDYRYIIS